MGSERGLISRECIRVWGGLRKRAYIQGVYKGLGWAQKEGLYPGGV